MERRNKPSQSVVPPEANQQPFGETRHQILNRRHNVLFRLRTNATPPAHKSGGQVLRRLRHTDGINTLMALHVPHVPAGRVHTKLPRRPGHNQPLQTSTDVENEKTRRIRNADVHDLDPDRRRAAGLGERAGASCCQLLNRLSHSVCLDHYRNIFRFFKNKSIIM